MYELRKSNGDSEVQEQMDSMVESIWELQLLVEGLNAEIDELCGDADPEQVVDLIPVSHKLVQVNGKCWINPNFVVSLSVGGLISMANGEKVLVEDRFKREIAKLLVAQSEIASAEAVLREKEANSWY